MRELEGSVEGRECGICERTIERRDIARLKRCDEQRRWVHLACTEHGVERFLKDGADDFDDPLEWDRAKRPRWYWDPSLGTWWNHRDEDERVGHDHTRYPSW